VREKWGTQCLGADRMFRRSHSRVQELVKREHEAEIPVKMETNYVSRGPKSQYAGERGKE